LVRCVLARSAYMLHANDSSPLYMVHAFNGFQKRNLAVIFDPKANVTMIEVCPKSYGGMWDCFAVL
jgi:hypothetical protein